MNWFSKGEKLIRDNFCLETKIPSHQGIKSWDSILRKIVGTKKKSSFAVKLDQSIKRIYSKLLSLWINYPREHG